MRQFTLAMLLLIVSSNLLFSQQKVKIDTTGLTLQSIGVPSTPAFLMLGIEPSSIEKPKDPKDFLVSIANASQKFSTLPQSFAMEISPFMMLRKDHVSLRSYLSNDNIGNNIFQTFTISLATNTLDSISGVSPITTELGAAVKFSILRGKIKNKTLIALNKIDSTLAGLNTISYESVEKYLQGHPEYKAITEKIKSALNDPQKMKQLSERFETLGDSLSAAFADESKQFNIHGPVYDKLKEQASNIVFVRNGFKLDAACGLVYDFPFQEADSIDLSRLGAWLTGGWNFTGKGQAHPTWNILGSARVLKNFDQVYELENGMNATDDNLNFDVGAKVEFTRKNKLAISLEYLQRFSNNDEIDPTYRLAFNGNYQVTPSYQVSLTFGRNFNGTISEGGNLLAALHLFGSFGSRETNTSATKK